LPLIVTCNSHYSYTLGKAIFFRIDLEILLALYVPLILLDPECRPRITPLTWSFTAYGAALVISTALSLSPYRSWWGTLERMDGVFPMLHYVLFFLLLTALFHTRQDWSRFFHISLGISLLVAANALAQRYATGLPRVGSTMGGGTFLSTYALFQIFFAVLTIYWGTTWFQRLWGASGLALNVVSLVLAAGRGATVGLAAGLFAVALEILIFKRNDSRMRVAALAAVVALLAVPLIIRSARGTAALKWNYALERLSAISGNDPTTRTRLIALGVSWQAFKTRPGFGYGPELYNVAYSRHFNPEQLSYEQGWFDRAHNKLADVLVMEGLFGLICYLGLFVSAAWLLYGWAKREARDDLTPLIASGMLVAYFVQNLFLFDTPSSYLLFFALLAFLSVGADLDPKPSAPVASKPVFKVEPQPRLKTWQLVMITSTALAMILTIYNLNWKGFRQAQLGGELLGSEGDPRAFLETFRESLSYDTWATNEVACAAADTLYATETAQNPAYWPLFIEVTAALDREIRDRHDPDPRTYLRLAVLYSQMALVDRSFLPKSSSLLRAAMAMAPKWPESYDALGTNYLMEGKIDEAWFLLRQAVDINPDNGNARWALALALILNGRTMEGMAELKAALPRYDYHNSRDLRRLVNAYYTAHDLSQALQFQKELTDLEPNDAVHHATLARLHKESGDSAIALREIQLAAQLDPRYRAAVADFEPGR
jgi:O-antigen ligase/Tfp pilus assembly protein PilF